jgi:hypothetical protein
VPVTSGDLEAAYSAPFRVEYDQGVEGFTTYAEAAAFKRDNGGRVRARGA